MDSAAGSPYDPGGGNVRDDETRAAADLPELLEILGEVSERVGALSLSRRSPASRQEIGELRERLLFARHLLEGLFALRAEPVPDPEPGFAFDSLGPSLRRTLPQRLAAQLEDERNGVTERSLWELSSFAAFGLHARVVELLRLVDWVEELAGEDARRAAPPTVISLRHASRSAAKGGARATPPSDAPSAPPPRAAPAPKVAPPPPPPPEDPGPDLSAYDLRIDEAGERIDVAGASAWFASAAGPRAEGPGLAASFAVAFPGGIALAVATGAESSLGGRLAAVVAARTFCRAAAAGPSDPLAAVRTAQGHLEMLLAALLAAGDSSDAVTRVRGTMTPDGARRVLSHTRVPDGALRRVPPALACGLVGAVGLVSGGRVEAAAVRLGPGSVQVRRAGAPAPVPFAPKPPEPSFLAPGALGAAALGRSEAAPPVSLARGDALLLATPAVGRGAPSAWSSLATLWPPFPDGLGDGSSARKLLERAERWGVAEPPSFAGPLGIGVLLAR
ncbi:MAG: hypothetical protein ACYC4P_14310 [Thermoanaerobaculia bacterium]